MKKNNCLPLSRFRRNTRGLPLNAILTVLLLFSGLNAASAAESYISTENETGSIALVSGSQAIPLCVSSADYPGVLKTTGHLQTDIEAVTGIRPKIIRDTTEGKQVVIIGTIGKSPLIDQLIKEKKINGEAVTGLWDTYALQTVTNPLPGVEQALVIYGSNKRGTIYGMYDLSAQIGVSPWYWWADAPIQKKSEIYVQPGFYSPGEPKVKYRGIFLNDEAPALSGWVEENYGSFNHEFYEKVYELILRNKGNYLWPAMWPPKTFFEDDPKNFELADEMGVVISTSHHEPMMRAHADWYRAGGGEWNYETNAKKLQQFWRDGLIRMGDKEGVVTMGMRGDGDTAMGEGTAIELLKRIVKDQREIIEEVTGKPAEETPQVWALYKEVQDYYDKGMRVPDDIMILLCDDNWGNVRILPKKEDLKHKGGFGIYYHFDFVGGPVSYRWINVTQIEKVWEQMNLCYEWGVRDLWLVNVGDLKPMELPISFFLDFAWNPEAITAEDLPGYYVSWAKQQFGPEYAEEIADILSLQTKYNARRTPEMIKPDTYSLINYREADSVVNDYRDLVKRAKTIYEKLPESDRAAFFQLVLHPTEASCNINEIYVAAGKNLIYGIQGRASTNSYAEKVKTFFDKDAALNQAYHELENGKWNHMMSQTHIGYISWDNPPVDRMPAVSWVHNNEAAGLGYVLEMDFRPRGRKLPAYDRVNDQRYYIEVFNTGIEPLAYSVKTEDEWITLSTTGGEIPNEEKVYVGVDWDKLPQDVSSGNVTISGAGQEFTVEVPILKDLPEEIQGFVENNGVVSIEAKDYTNAINSDGARWQVVPNLGRTASAVMVEPANADRQTPEEGSPCLEYEFTLFTGAELKVDTYLSPTLNYKKNEGLKYAIAIDDEAPQIVNMHEGETAPDWEYPAWWNNSVTDHIKIKSTTHPLVEAGKHTLKVWMVDPGVVFQKFVINAGGLKPSYLGPQESLFLPTDSN